MHDPNESRFIGDKESSIHFDMNRVADIDGMDDRSSTSSKNKAFHGANKSSRMSQSNVSARSGGGTSAAPKKKKKVTTDTASKKGGNVSDTTSIKSGKSKTGKKKKKAAGNKDGDKSFDSDTSRTLIIAAPVEEPKVEEPVIPERPKREFKESDKVRLMNQGVDMLRE